MFYVITEHEYTEGYEQAAQSRIQHNGREMAKRAGFVSRVLLRPAQGQGGIASVTVWESEAHYGDWVAARNRSAGAEDAWRYYATVTNRTFEDWTPEAGS